MTGYVLWKQGNTTPVAVFLSIGRVLRYIRTRAEPYKYSYEYIEVVE